jgi:hypothetical protein
MDNDANQFLEEALRRRFSEFVSSRGVRIDAVLHTMQTMRTRGWTVFFFGGVPRGVFDDGKNYQPRDLDLVFDDDHYSSFESAFEHHIVKRNNYGGLKLEVKGFRIDAWPLSSTWAFRKGILSEPSFKRLPQTTFLNIDAVVVEAVPPKFRKRQIFDGGFFAAWRDKILDINLKDNPYPAICVARSLHLSKYFGFQLSHNLAAYIHENLAETPIMELLDAQTSHYGFIEFDAKQLLKVYQMLEHHLGGTDSDPLALFPLRPAQSNLEMRLNEGDSPDFQRNRSDCELFEVMQDATV